MTSTTTTTDRHDEDDDHYDFWDDQCGCAGEDDWGRTICACRESCCCDRCEHDRHVATRRCAVLDCTAPSTVQVRAWSVSHHRVQAHRIDPDLTPDTGGDEWVDVDDTPSYGWCRTACSQRHARQLVDDDRAWAWRQQAEAGKDPDRRLRYEITSFRYEPDRMDLPEVLAELRALGDFLRYRTANLARAGYDPTDAQTAPVDVALADARRDADRLVEMLAALSTTAPEPRRYSAGDPEPGHDVRLVRRGGDHYHRADRRDGSTIWFGATAAAEHHWDQLTAAGELVEVPRHQLVVPTTGGPGIAER